MSCLFNSYHILTGLSGRTRPIDLGKNSLDGHPHRRFHLIHEVMHTGSRTASPNMNRILNRSHGVPTELRSSDVEKNVLPAPSGATGVTTVSPSDLGEVGGVVGHVVPPPCSPTHAVKVVSVGSTLVVRQLSTSWEARWQQVGICSHVMRLTKPVTKSCENPPREEAHRKRQLTRFGSSSVRRRHHIYQTNSMPRDPLSRGLRTSAGDSAHLKQKKAWQRLKVQITPLIVQQSGLHVIKLRISVVEVVQVIANNGNARVKTCCCCRCCCCCFGHVFK